MSDDVAEVQMPTVVIVTEGSCPMCGTANAPTATSCANCGEPLADARSADQLTVPLYSRKLIGICTLFWSLPAGMTLLWLNCRRLKRDRDAWNVLCAGVGLTMAMTAIGFVIPASAIVVLGVAIGQILIVVNFAGSILHREYQQQRRQGGPYPSTILANVIAVIMLIIFIAIQLSIMVALEFSGVDIIELVE